MKIGFDSEKYIREQSKYILERVNDYDKLYLEFGGKLIGDMHAKRVLPGFDEDAKIKLLQKLKHKVEIIICVYAGDIERNKVRGDFGITYDMDVLKLIDDLRSCGLSVNSVCITRYNRQPVTTVFKHKLERRNIKVYTHNEISGYPTDVDKIVSEDGYGRNAYIKTTKPIVVVIGPGAGSGKLATCLSQLYHENKRGRQAGYSKFETFPVWNVSLKHPLNIAYEAATVDLNDVNMMDYFHYEEYKEAAVNYNRDLEMFPVISRIIERITGKKSIYKSPTDMGVNRVGFGIIDDEAVLEASKQEIIRRYLMTACDFKKGLVNEDSLNRMKVILEELNLRQEDRKCVLPARNYADKLSRTFINEQQEAEPAKQSRTFMNEQQVAVLAFELMDGSIVTGRAGELMDCAAAAVLNAVKYYAGIDDEVLLLTPLVLGRIRDLKMNHLSRQVPALSANEILIALSICATTDETARRAYEQLSELKGTQAHCTVMLSRDNELLLKKLGVDITCDPEYSSDNLYYFNN